MTTLASPAPTPTSAPVPGPDPASDPEDDQDGEENAPDATLGKWTLESWDEFGEGIPMAEKLRRTWHSLGNVLKPRYKYNRYTHRRYGTNWKVSVFFYKSDNDGWKEVFVHHDVAKRDTMESRIAEATRRALYVQSHWQCHILARTSSRYTPYRATGEAKTHIAPITRNSPCLNNLRELLAATNTALDDTNNALYEAQKELYELRWERDLLATAVRGDDPQKWLEVEFKSQSPNPKRPHYNSPDARTEDL